MSKRHYLIDITGIEVGGEMFGVKGWFWTPENRSMTPDRVVVDDGSDFPPPYGLRIGDVTASITNEDGCIQQHQYDELSPFYASIAPDIHMLLDPLTRPCGASWELEFTNECECCAPPDA